MNNAKSVQEIKNEYQRQWRKQNKEKIRQYNESYWERKLAKLQAEQQNPVS